MMMPTSNRSKLIVAVLALAALTLAVFAGVNLSGSQASHGEPGSPGDPAQVVAEEDAVSPVGVWLATQEPPSLVPAPSESAVAEFGEQDARVGIAVAEAISHQTAFLSNLWYAEGSPTPEDYSALLPLMTANGKATYLSQTASPAAIDANLLGSFVFTPSSDPKVVWSPIPMRPDGNSYTIVSTGVGPKSTYNNKPTLKVDFKDFHVYDWAYDGKPVAQEIGRSNVYYLAETGDPQNPWLLDAWTTTALPPIDVEPRVAARSEG